MRKALAGSLAAVVVTALTLAPASSAQIRGRAGLPGMEVLQGSGGHIGVSVRELTSDEMSRARVERPGGVFVESVREGSPAARAGLRSGDIIMELDGERVRGVRHCSRLVLETPPGRAVKGGIIRDGMRLVLDVTPEAAPPLSARLPEISREIERRMRSLSRDFDFDVRIPQGGQRARLGMTVTPLTDQLASYFGVQDGVLVSKVEADSPASRAGIRAGDVITAINGRTPRLSADVAASLRAAVPGSTVEIGLVRDKKELTVKATVPDRQSSPAERAPV